MVAVVLLAALQAASLSPDEAVAKHASLAGAAMQAGEYPVAEQHFKAVVKLRPDLAEARTNLGLSLYLQKKYEDAIRTFTAGLKIKPDMSNAWLFLGISQFHLNRPQAAIQSLTKYRAQRPADFQGSYFLGLSYLALEKYDEAERALIDAGRLAPRSVDALYHLAQVYLNRARKEPASANEIWPLYEKTVERIAAIDPESFRLAQMRAGYYEAIGKKSEAIGELQKLLANDPRVRGLHYSLGCLYLEGVQHEKAAEQFRKELELDSPYPRTLLQLGHVYVALNKPDQALPVLREAAAAESADRGAAWVDMGRAYRSLGQFDAASRAFQKAIELGERGSSVYYQLAGVARRAGLSNVAAEAMRKSQAVKAQEKTPE